MVANFSVVALAYFINDLDVVITVSSENRDREAVLKHTGLKSPTAAKDEEAERQAVEHVTALIETSSRLFQLMSSGHLENAVNRLRHWVNGNGRSWDDLFTRSCALRDAIRIELKEYLFYAYPKDKGQKFVTWKNEWDGINTAFPDVKVDAFCATDCYALGHATASVFHSMRVAEIGLRALARERRISLPKSKPIEWGTWQEIIKALDDEIRTIGQTWKAGRRKDTALEFYSGARADLNGFKDEFRNLVMHVRVQYDEFQALRALTRVQEFMSRLSRKLDYKHNRINWGRS